MDPLNIIAAVNIIALLSASATGVKREFRSQLSSVKEKPKTWLQNIPNFSAFIVLLQIISLFQVGTFTYSDSNFKIRVVALVVYGFSSWMQFWSFKSLGKFHSQNIVIMKNHELMQKGPYKVVRHPQYLFQIITDLALSIAILSYLSLPLALIQLPLYIMRASLEETYLLRYFGEAYTVYKKKTGFIIPFIG
ncbi:MAG: isoprenylcysteine carboxylmethyltransferase family protein [Ignavibacteria bacterium]|nr:isoprenylcysteine carboxylmethyltransferase family protein [Ignavibacteria bacterium]